MTSHGLSPGVAKPKATLPLKNVLLGGPEAATGAGLRATVHATITINTINTTSINMHITVRVSINSHIINIIIIIVIIIIIIIISISIIDISIMCIITMTMIMIMIIIIIISSSSRSTQRSARRAVDEMHVFQKEKVLSPRPEASFQVYFNATTHILKLRCKTTKMFSPRLGKMHLFEICSEIM